MKTNTSCSSFCLLHSLCCQPFENMIHSLSSWRCLGTCSGPPLEGYTESQKGHRLASKVPVDKILLQVVSPECKRSSEDKFFNVVISEIVPNFLFLPIFLNRLRRAGADYHLPFSISGLLLLTKDETSLGYHCHLRIVPSPQAAMYPTIRAACGLQVPCV